MSVLSIIIPARNEKYLQQTIDDLFAKANGDIEIIAVLDGYWPNPPLKDDPRLVLIHHGESRGMRAAINAGAKIAKGKYLMKCDAHCCFDKGFDEKLIADCKENWVLVPVQYDLDEENWDRMGEPHEFQYIRKDDLRGKDWPEYAERVKGQDIVDLMVSQGSCRFMHKSWSETIGGLDEINYGTIGREALEVACKTWQAKGRYALARCTWYAHRPVKEETYPRPHDQVRKSIAYAESQRGAIAKIVEKFAPVPSWHEEPKKENPTLIKEMARAGLYDQWHEKGFKVGAEIGVWDGLNAKAITRAIPGVKLYLVDPYKDYPRSQVHRRPERMEEAWNRAHKYTRRQNVEFMKMPSLEAVSSFADGSLDFVYIDGNHTYDFVMLDILLWVPKVRRGGIIAGHDYYYDPGHGVDVRTVVDSYAKAHGIKFYITDKMAEKNGRRAMASWFWEQP